MAPNFLPIHCRKRRRHIPSRDHKRRRQHSLLPRQRQRHVVPARKRHGAIAGNRPQSHEGDDRRSPLKIDNELSATAESAVRRSVPESVASKSREPSASRKAKRRTETRPFTKRANI